MSYATVLLHLEDDAHAAAATRHAAALARAFDAHLEGLSCRPAPPSPDDGAVAVIRSLLA